MSDADAAPAVDRPAEPAGSVGRPSRRPDRMPTRDAPPARPATERPRRHRSRRSPRTKRGTERTTPVPEPTAEPTSSTGDRPRRGAPVHWIPAIVLGVAVVVLRAGRRRSHGVYWAKPDDSAGARAPGAGARRGQEVLRADQHLRLPQAERAGGQGSCVHDGHLHADLHQALQTRSCRRRRSSRPSRPRRSTGRGSSRSARTASSRDPHLRPARAVEHDDRQERARASTSSAPSSRSTRSTADG